MKILIRGTENSGEEGRGEGVADRYYGATDDRGFGAGSGEGGRSSQIILLSARPAFPPQAKRSSRAKPGPCP
jgi:hypothetical protein